MNALADITAAHATYSPSSAHRWTVCTASAEGIAKLPPQEESEAAQAGTAAHEEIERLLRPLAEYGLAEFVIDPENPAIIGIGLMFDYVRQLVNGRSVDDKIWIEERVALTPEIWGRPDVVHWNAADRVLTVADLKNGFVGVDAEENAQLRIYAAACMFTHKLPVKHIRYAIIQPNDFRPLPRVKQWSETVDSLYAWAEVVSAIPSQSKKFVAGENCTYCPLFGRCEATRDILRDLSALVAGLMTPDQVSPEQRALFLICQKPIKDAFTAAEKAWSKLAMSGTEMPGLKLVTSQKHKAWSNPVEARALVIEKLGADALDLPSPAQAIERGLDEATVNAMAPRPPGSPVLAFANDKRPEWKKMDVQSMFGGVAALVAKS
jgi:Protein of unknown function (DUF2800)